MGCQKETVNMAHVMDLPLEVLNTILTFVVMSGDGARDWVSLSVTCQAFNTLATQLDVLRVVNCQNVALTGCCEPHHRLKGLLCRCVQAGNLGVRRLLGKAVLKGGPSLWRVMLENDLINSSIKCATALPLVERRHLAESLNSGSIADLPYVLFVSEDVPHLHESYGRLQHMGLVKSFVMAADTRELVAVCCILKAFVEWFVGYDRSFESDIDRMRCYESVADSLTSHHDPLGATRSALSMLSGQCREDVMAALDRLL